MNELYPRLAHDLLTLYMMLILLRWFGPTLSLEVESGRLRWISGLTDPLITRIRRVLPHMGPMDFGPVAALFLVWFIRVLSDRVFIEMALRGPV